MKHMDEGRNPTLVYMEMAILEWDEQQAQRSTEEIYSGRKMSLDDARSLAEHLETEYIGRLSEVPKNPDGTIDMYDPEYIKYAILFNDITHTEHEHGHGPLFSTRNAIAKHLWELGYRKVDNDLGQT